ncbi:MAG: SCO family protein [Bacteroidota bacterium]|nr:SCO family protein [Bacteroidota bacterium]
MKKILSLFLLIFILSCNQKRVLPIMGERTPIARTENGKTVIDTQYATVPPFVLLNQEGDTVSEALVKGKIYVADFFFTSCPTICPIMKKEMLRVYEKVKGNDNFMLLSHTIDPDFDSIPLLKEYAKRLGSDGKQWQFLTGQREAIYELAEKGYYATAMPDSTEPGGYVHSGGFILVDKQSRVRGVYNGTDAKEVDLLIEDLFILSEEKE